MKKPDMHSNVALVNGDWFGSNQNKRSVNVHKIMYTRLTLAARPEKYLSVTQPPKTIPSSPNSSYPATNQEALLRSMPRASLRNVGPQSSMPYRTEYTKKLEIESSQI